MHSIWVVNVFMPRRKINVACLFLQNCQQANQYFKAQSIFLSNKVQQRNNHISFNSSSNSSDDKNNDDDDDN